MGSPKDYKVIRDGDSCLVKAANFRETGGESIGKAPVSSADAQAFANTYANPQRFEGVAERMELGAERPKARTGEFVKLVCEDVEVETRNERSTSGLEWKQVKGYISALAAEWFLCKHSSP